jgi:predicted nucleic acid-binding Zn finger protein
MNMAGWNIQILDVRGAFLHDHFDAGEKIYLEIPHIFKKFYPLGVSLEIKRTLCGAKQATVQYWKESQSAF